MREMTNYGVFLEPEVVQEFLESIQLMNDMYDDKSLSDYFEADDIAINVARRLGELIESNIRSATNAVYGSE